MIQAAWLQHHQVSVWFLMQVCAKKAVVQSQQVSTHIVPDCRVVWETALVLNNHSGPSFRSVSQEETRPSSA